LTSNLAAELGPRGINVNAIAPGLVDNESGYRSLPKDSPIREALAARIPGKTSGPPEDIVGVLLLLCSRAGDWINGQTILVDGGWIARL
jgi:NAD(P)-dependent dehydrogenase (short-subunit alcohol dehydrogenase family)